MTVLAAIALASSVSAAVAQEALLEASSTSVQARDGTISLSGGSGNSFWTNALYIVPLLAAIIILDFAIFGTFATRSDELNPVSQFFFKAKEGLHIIRNRNSHIGNRNSYQNRPSPFRPTHTRVTR